MLKRKKIFIVIVVLVLMLAMTVTASAGTMYYCYLRVDNIGEAETNALSTVKAQAYGYNSQYSTNVMKLKFQWKVAGEWQRIGSWNIQIDDWDFKSGYATISPARLFRTKIYSANYIGGVEGSGQIANY